MYKIVTTFVVALVLITIGTNDHAYAEDKHAGYYYPVPTSFETYKARAPRLTEARKNSRTAFVTALIKQATTKPYAPDFLLYAKGEDNEKAIITAIGKDRYQTIYQMRALMAMMTGLARVTPMFQQSPAGAELTFLDMLYMMGFTQITISDGDKVAHQIIFE